MVPFSNGRDSAMVIALVSTILKPNHLKTGTLENGMLLSRFQMVFFKWRLLVRISDPIQNPDYLQPNLFLTPKNPD